MRRAVLTLLAIACAEATEPSASPGRAPSVRVASQIAPKTPRDHPPQRSPEPPSPSCPPLVTAAPELISSPLDVPIPKIVDPDRTLAGFYDRLARVLRGRAGDHVRIAVYGDSNLTNDFFTGEMRRVLQQRYGDAGHGYVAIGKPWSWYTHMDVVHGIEPKAWRSYAVSTHAVVDQIYGFGGIAAQSISHGARAWVKTASGDAPIGRTVSRVDVYYLMHPGGRWFEVRVDGESEGRVDSRAPEPGLGFHRFELPDAPHSVVFYAQAGVRLFGVALERGSPSIVIDSLGVGGANLVHLARMQRSVALQALTRRNHDLVMFLTGGTADDDDRHDIALEHLVDLHRNATPNCACLVMSPPDFGYGGLRAPRPSKRIGRLAKRKRRAAGRLGCAYWDFRGAMGGELSIVRFAEHGMAWGDLVHLTRRGGAYMARRFLYALWQDFIARSAERPDLGCGPGARPEAHPG